MIIKNHDGKDDNGNSNYNNDVDNNNADDADN